MSKLNENLNATEVIIEAIQTIARKGVVNPKNGVVKGTGKVTGYVAKIHTEGEFAGTIDVQEFSHLALEDRGDLKVGYHEAVRLSAIQDNTSGVVLIPKLYSEVVVTLDPVSQIEYVTMFSQVDWIKLDSHDKITIGVTEHEKFDPNDPDGPDVDELEATGVKSATTYEKDSIVSEVRNSEDETDSSRVSQTFDSFGVDIQEGKGTLLIDTEKADMTSNDGDSKLHLGKNETVLSTGDMKVEVTPDGVNVGGGAGSHAVLGEELCDILMKMLQAIASIKTTTQLGPQPPVNIAEFMAIRSQIQAMQSGLNGFISKYVQIKK